jgi:hypothetical protein
MKAKKINDLTLQITGKSGKIRNLGATKRTSVEEEKLRTAGPWFAPPTLGYEGTGLGYVANNKARVAIERALRNFWKRVMAFPRNLRRPDR